MYGAFYNWPAALQGAAPATTEEHAPIRGVCPEGWHIPSQAEWRQLAKYVLDAGLAAVGSDGVVDDTALAKALASKEMWLLPPFLAGVDALQRTSDRISFLFGRRGRAIVGSCLL